MNEINEKSKVRQPLATEGVPKGKTPPGYSDPPSGGANVSR